MNGDLWVWIYHGRAHGYYDSHQAAHQASRRSLHPTRWGGVRFARIVVDEVPS